MKILKCFGLLILLAFTAGVIGYIEHSLSIPSVIWVIPNMILGFGMGYIMVNFISRIMNG